MSYRITKMRLKQVLPAGKFSKIDKIPQKKL